MPSIERHSRESGHHLVAREPLRRRVRLTLQEEPSTDSGPGHVGIDVERSYVRGIDAGNQSRIVAVCDRIAAEQGATKTPASTSHKSAGPLHDIVSAVLDDLPINSKKRTNRGASLFKGIFLPHQPHDRARDHGFDLRHVRKTCLSDLHRRSTRTKQSRLQQQSLSGKRLTSFMCQFPHAPREGTVPLSQSRYADEATLATNWETERCLSRQRRLVSAFPSVSVTLILARKVEVS
jgi:hypothetical protein